MTLAVLILAASTLVTPPAPGGAADGETSTNAVLSLRPDGNVFRLTFAVEATPSNNVELALGADGNADGDLSTDETLAGRTIELKPYELRSFLGVK